MTTDLTYIDVIRWLSHHADAQAVVVRDETAFVSIPLRLVVQATIGRHRRQESPAVMLAEIMHQLNLCQACTEHMVEHGLTAHHGRHDCWEGGHETPYPRREVAA